MRILVVEDEVRLAEALVQILQAEKYDVEAVRTGTDGLDYALSGQYDVVLLDAMLPGMDGFDVVRQLRAQENTTPVLMLTAKDEVPDKVHGLDCGADDYMTKPFSPEELCARVRAVARRQGEVIMDELRFGDLTLNLSTNMLHCGSRSVRLGFKEMEVLKILMAHKQSITTKEELINKVWGANSDAVDNNVEAYISFLRKKFFYLYSTTGIETIRKMGYRMAENVS